MAQPVTVEPVTSGQATIKTTAGDILLEFWPREAPKAVRNFVQLALEGYYEGCEFFRVVPGLCVQTGDASNSGEGGDSIYDEGYFDDEFSQRLRFNRRGLVAMANTGKRNTNLSQFFITLDRADALQNQHTIFATVRGDTYFNVMKISELEIKPGTDRPVYPTIIKSIEIDDNPFPDIEPRITAAEKRAQEKARREARKNAASRGKKKEGVKNKSLMSFEDEEEGGTAGPSVKIGSAHDRLSNDPKLRKEVKSYRDLPGEMPEGFGERPSTSSTSNGKRKADTPTEEDSSRSKRASIIPSGMDSASFSKRIEREDASSRDATKPSASSKEGGAASDRVKAEIAKVQADLKRLTKRGNASDDEEQAEKANRDEGSRKKNASKISGAALLAAERAKYQQGGRSIGKGKGSAAAEGGSSSRGGGRRRKEEDEDLLDMLEGFRGRVKAATKEQLPQDGKREQQDEAIDGYAGEILEDDGDDEGWMAHTLKFRKDATMDQHTLDEYEVVDPRDQNMTLEEAKRQEARLKRASAAGGSGRLGGAATARAEKDVRRREGREGGGYNRARERY